MQCRCPIENFDRRGNRDKKTQHRENHAGINRLTADEHMMTPDREAQYCYCHARACDEAISENTLARKAGDQFADHTHAWKDHDVNRRMRIEPEEMLEQDRIAAEFRIENADAPEALDRHKHVRDCEHWRFKHHDKTCCVK